MRPVFGSLLLSLLLAAPAGAQPMSGAEVRLQAGIENEVAVEGYNNEPIVTYSKASDFFRLGRAVGQLRIVTDAGPAPCTAFIVSDRHIVTNHHCIPGVLDIENFGATSILSATFAAGFVNPGLPEEAELFEVNPDPVETDKALDYSVLEVLGNPSAKYGTLPLDGTEIVEGTPFLILGHPLGKSLHISREGCRAARPPIDGNRLRHTCDTLAGNSGSPIIDASTRTVVGLHNSGDRNAGVNFGIPMSLILASSKVLKAAPPPETTQSDRSMTLSLRPRSLANGEELYLTADMPTDCAPAFFDIAPSGRLTPVPLEFFERLDLSATQTRFQVTGASRYGLVILEEDERGRHLFGYVCAKAGGDLKDILRQIVPQLEAGVLAGAGSGTAYRFQDYTIR